MVATKELEQKMTASELTTDLKALVKEFYIGEVEENEKELVLVLTNGQRFKIAVEEVA